MNKAKEYGGRIFRPTINSMEEFIILLLGIGIGLLMIPVLTYKVIGFLIGLLYRYLILPMVMRFKRFLDGESDKR
jgi:hypothetical protein